MNNSLFKKLNNVLISQDTPESDIKTVKSAYDFASMLHEGQYRVSEEPYIVHPVEVACILASLQADVPTLCAALLHDILEDTDTKPEVIKEKFGEDVLKLVNGVTKLSKIEFTSKEERQAENFRKMFIAMAEDIRVIFLKLADRLHNMRTLNYMAAHKQKRIAEETLEIFAPLANRLGIGKIKAELEDLSLRYINPGKYYEIAQLVAQNKAERDSVVEGIISKINANLKTLNIDAVITGRSKHYYSIYAKMKRLNKEYHELYDITAVRVLVNTEKECYEVLGVIHSQFKPIPGRFKDYIAMPKSNLYRSLHTSVIGPRGKPVEVQIRTKEMHEIAEYGLAAHWKYKETGVKGANSSVDQKFSWLRKLIEIHEDVSSAKEYVDSVKLDLFSDQVFVFTPMGDVFDLPNGAVPIDFAYRVHTEVGHKCTGALVNGKIVTLDTKLQNGDIVEVLTAKVQNPRLDWLNIVATNQSKSRIKQWFKKNKKEDHINLGRSAIEADLTKAVFDENLKSGKFDEIAKMLNYQAADDMFAAVGYGETTVNKIVNKLKKPKNEIQKLKPRLVSKKDQKAITGLEGMLYHIAKCCSPVPGEPIVGVVTRSRGVSVHRIDCVSLEMVQEGRFMEINWSGIDVTKTYVVNLRIEVVDKLGIFKDVLAKISDQKTNIISASVKSKDKKFATIELGVEIYNIENLNNVINNIQALPDVISVRRKHTSGTAKKS